MTRRGSPRGSIADSDSPQLSGVESGPAFPALRIDSRSSGTGARVDGLTLGVVATSGKEHEYRLPIHPRHLERIDADLRRRMLLERGYGRRHGSGDDEL